MNIEVMENGIFLNNSSNNLEMFVNIFTQIKQNYLEQLSIKEICKILSDEIIFIKYRFDYIRDN